MMFAPGVIHTAAFWSRFVKKLFRTIKRIKTIRKFKNTTNAMYYMIFDIPYFPSKGMSSWLEGGGSGLMRS